MNGGLAALQRTASVALLGGVLVVGVGTAASAATPSVSAAAANSATASTAVGCGADGLVPTPLTSAVRGPERAAGGGRRTHAHACAAATRTVNVAPTAACPGANAVTGQILRPITQGSPVTGTFTVSAGCHRQVSLASYQAPAPNGLPFGSQSLFDSKTGFFDAGTYSFTVATPACYYQVDLVVGPVITTLDNPVGNLYGGRKLDYANGGVNGCGLK